MTDKKLYRSRNDKMLGGIAGGLGDYLGVDPTILRVIFVITLFFGGVGFWAYLVMWLVIPEEPETTRPDDTVPPPPPPSA